MFVTVSMSWSTYWTMKIHVVWTVLYHFKLNILNLKVQLLQLDFKSWQLGFYICKWMQLRKALQRTVPQRNFFFSLVLRAFYKSVYDIPPNAYIKQMFWRLEIIHQNCVFVFCTRDLFLPYSLRLSLPSLNAQQTLIFSIGRNSESGISLSLSW